MAVSFSEILSSAMLLIDDIRWQKELALNPAAFYRAKSEYINLALALMSSPPDMLIKLEQGMTPAKYDDYIWVSDEDSIGSTTVVQTDKIGYELMSCAIRVVDSNGDVSLIPCNDVLYDADTGSLTFPAQEESGIVYDLSFYTDGSFESLTNTQKRLFALAVAVVWDEHFERNWLNMQPKIKDGTFVTINESNFIDKNNERLMKNRQNFNDELHKYEQLCAYNSAVSIGNRQGRFM